MTSPVFFFVYFLLLMGSVDLVEVNGVTIKYNTDGLEDNYKPTMMLFQGEVDPRNCTKLPTRNTTECTVQCAKNQSCLMTVMKPKECTRCDYGQVSKLTRVQGGKYWIGLKISHGYVDLVRDEHFVGETLLSFLSFFNPAYNWNDDVCPYGETLLKTCDDGWQMFRRGNTSRCLRVLTSEKPMNQTDGAKLCEKYEAFLSGMETMEETRFVNESFVNQMKWKDPELSNKYAIWLDGKRKSECQRGRPADGQCSENWEIPEYCTEHKGFDFNDTTLKTFAGFDWSLNEPNDWACNQDCLVMTFSKEVSTNARTDDIDCKVDTINGYDLRGVLCGKQPQ